MSDRIGIEVFRGQVLPEWIDVNKHMNVAYYVLAFDFAVDTLWESFGITADYMAEQQGSTFAVESHITWQRELNEGDEYIIATQILGYDGKRIHQFMRMYHAQKGYLAATAEWMNLHVDLSIRRVSPWPDEILARIDKLAQSQTQLEWPAEAGQQMGLSNPLFSLRDRDQ